jgi:arylsulfatase A-like enzyme
MRGPGIEAGACSHVRATGVDLFPTIAELAHVGKPLPKGVEGGSLVSVLTNAGRGTVQRPREEFVVHFPHYDKDAIGPASALWLGDFKLVRVYETDAVRLFNIANDPCERRDLAPEMPGQANDLNRRLTDYLAAVNAQMPKPNPAYDGIKPTQTRGGGKRQAKP